MVAVVIVDIGNAGLVVIDVLYFHLRDAKHIVQLSVLVLMFLDIAIYTGLYESDISSVRFAITNYYKQIFIKMEMFWGTF